MPPLLLVAINGAIRRPVVVPTVNFEGAVLSFVGHLLRREVLLHLSSIPSLFAAIGSAENSSRGILRFFEGKPYVSRPGACPDSDPVSRSLLEEGHPYSR